jgi:hypothetical protein
MYSHVVNNSAIAVWIIYFVVISKLTRTRNIDDEPRIYEYTKSALLIYIQYPSIVAAVVKNKDTY